eukprot:TRINITY_DN8824_c0_g1_i1.p2 TRINITY_DN8824_c0_g1~~TRINITY_DN8824_c0_g1_i1.p2  ORF type:complete len:106 (+),score=42.30 TRINITY_DN8824_c0_g1_i1:99-416(+)
MIRRPPRSTLSSSSAASDVYKRQYQRRVRGTKQPITMGAAKAKKKAGPTAKERVAKDAAAKASGEKCKICMTTFQSTVKPASLKQHAESKHPKNTPADCFPNVKF